MKTKQTNISNWFLAQNKSIKILIICVMGFVLPSVITISNTIINAIHQPKDKTVAGVSTCDTQKQLEQLSYLYEAKIKTEVMQEKNYLKGG